MIRPRKIEGLFPDRPVIWNAVSNDAGDAGAYSAYWADGTGAPRPWPTPSSTGRAGLAKIVGQRGCRHRNTEESSCMLLLPLQGKVLLV